MTDKSLMDVSSEATPITNETIKKYICPEATDQELTLFKNLCIARNLNPFIKEAYLVKYKGNANIIVGKDTFIRRASNHPKNNGFKAGIIIQRDKSIVYQEGSFKLPTDKLLGGWAEAHKKDIEQPTRIEVSMDEYSSGQSTWNKMPATMIRKVALVQALREAYPDEFSGLYDESELGAIQKDGSKAKTTIVESAPVEIEGKSNPQKEAFIRRIKEMPVDELEEKHDEIIQTCKDRGFSKEDCADVSTQIQARLDS